MAGNPAASERARRFQEEREKLNQIVMSYDDLTIKRFFSLDSQAYRPGALPAKTKELLGLVSSLVLRCDDCILYHLIRCKEEGVTDAELIEATGVGLLVGGSITIPHLRRALQAWDEMKGQVQPAAAAASGEQPQAQSAAQPLFFDALISAARKIAGGAMERDAKLKRICALLAKSVSYYNWVGFYLVSPENPKELALGPFVGEPTEHTRIPFGKGICGQAAERKQIFTVQDVTKETNYLACSVKVKAEMVVPILKNGQVLGELDIDSHQLAPFTAEDRKGLSAICEIVAGML